MVESLCMCVCASAYVHTVCVCLANTIMQPFSAIPECSKTIKHQTEVLTVDYSGSKSEPDIMKPLFSIKLLYVSFSTPINVVLHTYNKQHVLLLIKVNIC